MSNAVTVVTPEEHVARVQRLGAAAVWIDVAVVARLADAKADRPIIVIGDPERDRDPRVAHVVRAGIADDQLQALLTAVATGAALASPVAASMPQSAEEARLAQRAFAASRRLATATDLGATEASAVQALCELLDVERAQLLYYNADSGEIWSEAKLRAGGDDRRASTGMVGWSAITGLPCGAQIGGDDPRYSGAIDDPDGDPASPILVHPILGADARVHAVLVASRRPRRPPLGQTEVALLARFAALAVPLLDQLSTHVEGQQLLDTGGEASLFRAEAVAAMSPQQWGDVVRVAPAWLPWAYRLLLVLIAGAIAFAALGTVSTYSSGPAVIRSMARMSVTARTNGNVAMVDVSPGERVAAGAVIARLDDIDQRATVDRLDREFETQLRNHMQDPGDSAADGALRTLRLELEQARNALDERSIRAPTAGLVTDVRVRSGQHVEPGDIAASVVEGSGGLEIVALLPGEDRPQLALGMPLRLELAGYSYAYQSLVIDSVSSDVIAPNEAKRMLGADIADSLQLGGPVVVVHGRLPSSDFEVDGRVFHYHDGMLGTAEVPVRTERIVVALIPGLRRL